LFKNNFIEKYQSKWFRNLSDAKISIIDQIYTLKVNENKRKLIYDKNNKLVGTKAYRIDKTKDITNK
jgi:hypothetical protein